MTILGQWRKEPGARVEGSRALDMGKVQAPCVVRAPEGGYRLFYTAVGPGKPFADCQGYILSAVSVDGLRFVPEAGIRIAPSPASPRFSLRALAPSVIERPGGGWRMYFEARGPADRPTLIWAAQSDDQIHWRLEGSCLEADRNLGAPRASVPANGGVRLLVFRKDDEGTAVVAATSADGLTFKVQPGVLMRDGSGALDAAGITAAEIIAGDPAVMVYSGWQDRPGDARRRRCTPASMPRRSRGVQARTLRPHRLRQTCRGTGRASFLRHRRMAVDGPGATFVIEGDGYGGVELDAVHAEDMSVIALGDGRYRMYYAACDAHGVWRIASAISD